MAIMIVAFDVDAIFHPRTELTGTVGSWRFDDAEASQNISKSYESLGTVACYEPGLLNFSIR